MLKRSKVRSALVIWLIIKLAKTYSGNYRISIQFINPRIDFTD